MTIPDERALGVTSFWRNAGAEAWFTKDPVFDEEFRCRFLDLHYAAARRELDACTRLETPTGLDETAPQPFVPFVQQQQFRCAAGPLLAPEQTGRHHTRLVGHEQVARVEMVDDLTEALMVDRTGPLVQDEQATGIAGLCRCLCDELIGEVVGEVIGPHGHPSVQAPSCCGPLWPHSTALRMPAQRDVPPWMPCGRRSAPHVPASTPPSTDGSRSTTDGTCASPGSGWSPAGNGA